MGKALLSETLSIIDARATKSSLQHHPEQQPKTLSILCITRSQVLLALNLKNDPFLLFREYLADLTTKTGKFSLKTRLSNHRISRQTLRPDHCQSQRLSL